MFLLWQIAEGSQKAHRHSQFHDAPRAGLPRGHQRLAQTPHRRRLRHDGAGRQPAAEAVPADDQRDEAHEEDGQEAEEKIMPFSKYSSKQKKLAAIGGNRKKIDAADFKKLRNSTTAKKVMKKKKR